MDDTNSAGVAPLEAPVRPCQTARDSWDCKNMKPVEGDLSMTHEHYSCAVCGRRMALDYDEMR